MKKVFVLLTMTGSLLCSVMGQAGRDYSQIDIMLIRGDYDRVIDTCNQILGTDSLNAEIWYRSGIAYQNVLPAFDNHRIIFALPFPY